MEYISAERLLNQSKEVQKVFSEYWKCNEGDLYVDKRDYEKDKRYCNILCLNIDLESDIEGDWEYFKTTAIQVLSLGQLIEFIHDNDYLIDIETFEGFQVTLKKRMSNGTQLIIRRINSLDLIDLIWSMALYVALEIAKEELKE
jgi:hypothetical protein